jgi:hypothetical protein
MANITKSRLARGGLRFKISLPDGSDKEYILLFDLEFIRLIEEYREQLTGTYKSFIKCITEWHNDGIPSTDLMSIIGAAAIDNDDDLSVENIKGARVDELQIEKLIAAITLCFPDHKATSDELGKISSAENFTQLRNDYLLIRSAISARS